MKSYTYRISDTSVSHTSLTVPGNIVLLGVAKATSWSEDCVEQSLSARQTQIPEVLGYLKLEEIRKAVRTETLGEVDSIQVENSFYTLDGTETHIYLKSRALNHNHLRADSFRVLFLVQQAVFVEGVNTDKDFFYPEEVLSAEWFYATCFSPVYRQHRLEQQFKLVVNSIFLSVYVASYQQGGIADTSNWNANLCNAGVRVRTIEPFSITGYDGRLTEEQKAAIRNDIITNARYKADGIFYVLEWNGQKKRVVPTGDTGSGNAGIEQPVIDHVLSLGGVYHTPTCVYGSWLSANTPIYMMVASGGNIAINTNNAVETTFV